MEILFRSDDKVFFIDESIGLHWFNITNESFSDVNIDKVTHLNDSKILYHYIVNGYCYPVYYDSGYDFITNLSIIDNPVYDIFPILDGMLKDYTIVNLKLLEDENTI